MIFLKKQLLLMISTFILSIGLFVIVSNRFIKWNDITTLSFLFLILIIYLFSFYLLLKQYFLFSVEYSYILDGNLNVSHSIDFVNIMTTYRDDISFSDFDSFYSINITKYLPIIATISSILVTVGLLGTVFGLIVSFSSLKNMVKSTGDAISVLQEVNLMLSGIDVAFFTTLFGAFFGGVMIRIYLSIFENSAQFITKHMYLRLISNNVFKSQKIDNKNKIESLDIIRDSAIKANSEFERLSSAIRTLRVEIRELSTIPLQNQIITALRKIEENNSQLAIILNKFGKRK